MAKHSTSAWLWAINELCKWPQLVSGSQDFTTYKLMENELVHISIGNSYMLIIRRSKSNYPVYNENPDPGCKWEQGLMIPALWSLVNLGEANDPREGTSWATQPHTPTGEEETGHQDLEALLWDRNFVLEQRSNPMLNCAYEQLAPIDGEMTVSQGGNQYPHFALKKECLCRIVKNHQMGAVQD